MKVYIPGSCFLLLMLQVNVAAEICEKDWWGPKCQFICYCKDNIGCNREGVCDDHECKEHHYGPSCQYEDILSHANDGEVTKEYLFDFNDQTCNESPSANVVEIKLVIQTPFTWYRIVVNNPNVIRNFTTTFNNGEPCWNERKFVVDNKTVDVTCDTEILLYSLRIVGRIAPSVCGLYISIGRNVALKQKIHQSSYYDESDRKKCGSANAVDSIEGDTCETGSCAQTGIEKSGPEFTLTLEEPTRLHYIFVYTAFGKQDRFWGFTMTLLDEFENLDQTYTAPNNEEDKKYQFPINTSTPITYIKIKQSTSVPLTDRYFTLCEISVLGDAGCPDDMFGLDCKGVCACQPYEACSYVTGACAAGCTDSRYGFNCSQRCSTHCSGHTCNPFTGHCQTCTGGFLGPRCQLECDIGTFVDKVQCTKCSPGCIGICDITNGSCSCKSGFEGARCQDCLPGSYGPELMCMSCHYGCNDTCDKVTGECRTCKKGFTGCRCSDCEGTFVGVQCNFNCSKGCDYRCNIVDGLCSCDTDFKGPLCSECEASYYGPRCDVNCPQHCLNKICFRANGTCPACETGYSGRRCDDSGGLAIEWILALLFLAAVMTALCCLFLCMKYSKKKSPTAEEE